MTRAEFINKARLKGAEVDEILTMLGWIEDGMTAADALAKWREGK